MKAMGAGFFVAAMGLFAVPHNAGPRQLLALAGQDGALGHGRAQVGLAMVAAGLALVALGALTGGRGRAARP